MNPYTREAEDHARYVADVRRRSRPERLTLAFYRLQFAEAHGKPEHKRPIRKRIEKLRTMIERSRETLRLARAIFGDAAETA